MDEATDIITEKDDKGLPVKLKRYYFPSHYLCGVLPMYAQISRLANLTHILGALLLPRVEARNKSNSWACCVGRHLYI